ncbi:MAG: YpdA family putative bacillithiol disulfide reductase [Candidatus Koribacter versatilis]|uniref:YpdA family putative bacillithiol disulfide reductase n=1 Tax=Candidatus Korobacter versatilis TaxID=658062 RepID=A0A932A633_9BACT|nr:YpdA family putative bacillithiol disulfide reductase [Candidatus Koribacter versatilis]
MSERSDAIFDLLVIGAGPTGLACAIEAKRAGFRVVLVEKGCLVNSLFHYPPQMLFFTTPELLEIGDIPFPSAHPKPTREEALEYYRKVTEHYELALRQYERVERVTGSDGDFHVHTRDRLGVEQVHRARKLALATGYYDLPNPLGVPGEDLPKVMHYYGEPHPYFGLDVVVVGGKNSAAIAALELWRRGARVTLVHRGAGIHQNVKYWIKPDIENRIKAGEVRAHFNSSLKEIGPEYVVLAAPGGEVRLKNDFVFALTGYHPDFTFMRSLGIELEPGECRPVCDPESLETNVPGIYVAGVIVAGSRTSEIFIENGRFHGRQIAKSLRHKLLGD